MKKYTFTSTLILLFSLIVNLSAQTSVSKDIRIANGEKIDRKVSSVSGDITIGQKARVRASVSTVSGDIEIGAKARIEDIGSVSGDLSIAKGAQTYSLETVSGDIHLYGENEVEGTIKTVSGDVVGESGSKIKENIITVSGDIELDDTSLDGDITTVSGDISLFNGTYVSGDIIIKRKNSPMQHVTGTMKVIIDLNSVVHGSIKVSEPDTNVIVILSNGGKVDGDIVNAEVRRQ